MREMCLIVLLAGLAVPPAPALNRFEAVEPHMGTLVRITVYTPDEASARRAFGTAFDRIRELDAILSDYRPDGELYRVSRDASERPMPVSDDLFAVLAASQELARATDGAFDVTQGPVVRLWREARASRRLPDHAALEDARRRSGFRKLVLDARDRTVTLREPGMSLDLGGIGKGYAASEALEALSRLGVDHALVAVSGDLAFSGAPPGRAGWRVRLPPATPDIPEVIELTHAAVSTSGPAAQHLEIDGRMYSHIIDPSSALGLEEDVSVTVMARHGIDADSLATAVSVLGSERGLRLVESRPDAAALIIRRVGTVRSVAVSSRFPHSSSSGTPAAGPR